MKLPYILLADGNSDHTSSFLTAFEKQVAYATVHAVTDGQSFLSYLADCGWKDIPTLLIINSHLSDMTAPDILRQLQQQTQYLDVPKLIWTSGADSEELQQCEMLGARHFLTIADHPFGIEDNVRKIDTLLKAELDLQ